MDLYCDLLRFFGEEAASIPATGRRLLAGGPMRDAERLFHTLKSSAASIGAHRIADLAYTAELAINRGDESRASQALAQIEVLLDALLPRLETILRETVD